MTKPIQAEAVGTVSIVTFRDGVAEIAALPDAISADAAATA